MRRKKESTLKHVPDLRRAEGILDERSFRSLSTDLHQMQEAYRDNGLGGYYKLLTQHFEKKDFFPPGDELKNFSQFPNLARFFDMLYVIALQDGLPLEKRILEWKQQQRAQNAQLSFDNFYTAIEEQYNASTATR